MMRTLRKWLSSWLLNLSMKAHPGIALPPGTSVFQIIAVPRRISETEAAQLADMVRNF